MIQHVFSSWVRQWIFLFGDFRSFYFHSLLKFTFLVSNGQLCLYDKKKKNTCLLVEMEYLFSCSTWHLTRELSGSTLEEKFHIYTHLCTILYSSYKQQRYTRISIPEKSRNNTREQIRYFFTCVWYRQSDTDTSLTFGVTRSGWWINGKPCTILTSGLFVRTSSDSGC